MERKLNVSSGAGGLVSVKRARFDAHVNECGSCQPNLCVTAQTLWRAVCVTALRVQQQHTPGGVR